MSNFDFFASPGAFCGNLFFSLLLNVRHLWHELAVLHQTQKVSLQHCPKVVSLTNLPPNLGKAKESRTGDGDLADARNVDGGL